jgi:membrane fusion protein, multidrug efflux system
VREALVFIRRIAAAVSWLAALVVTAFVLLPLIVGQSEEIAGQSEEAVEHVAESRDNGERPPIAVTYLETVPQRIEDIERALATVDAKWSARIAAEVAATIETIEVDVGSRVEPGQLLATLDRRDYEIELARATANVRRVETTIANTERDVARQRQLAERGHVADAALEQAETELAALRQELEAARSEVRRAERNLERTEIRAPHAGTVAERLVSEGDYVSAGSVILEIPRADRLQVRIPVPESAAERLSVGMPVRLATVGANPPVEAQITQIEPHVTSSNRTITAIAEIDNPGGWRPGSSVSAEIVLDRREGIALPPPSVVRRPGGNKVFVVEGDTARERAVSLGRRTSEWIEITEGVGPGERVIVDGAGFMSDGARISAHRDAREPAAPSVAAREEPRT